MSKLLNFLSYIFFLILKNLLITETQYKLGQCASLTGEVSGGGRLGTEPRLWFLICINSH